MYANYEHDEIGCLDCEEIEGHVFETSAALLPYLKEFETFKGDSGSIKNTSNKGNTVGASTTTTDNCNLNGTDTESSDTEYIYVPLEENRKYDCQSILSTYSNLYNHPKLITEPKRRTAVSISSIIHKETTK